jgi:hypothetical protein
MNEVTYGVLHYGDPRDFARPLSPDEEIQQALAALGAPVPRPRVADWPRLTDCTRRGSGFSLDARTPAIKASIRFDSSGEPLGDYEIHLQQRHHEKGRVVQVTAIPDADLWMHQYQAIREYPTRYIVVTSTPQGMQRVWLIGITSARPPIDDPNA